MTRLTKILFGRRTLAIVVAIVMVLQLLPMVTLAESVRTDATVEDTVGINRGEGKPGDDDFNPGGGLIGDPELPEKPTEPETPAEPEEPAEPENPAEPEEPAEPENPAEPEEPDITLSFPVVFVDLDGKVLARKTVKAGEKVGKLPDAPKVEGRTFIGWFAENGMRVTADTIVNGALRVSPSYDGDIVEVEYPAQSFRASASNGVRVDVTAPEGVFPVGTTMRVAAVDDATAMRKAKEASSKNVVDAVAVDISFRDAEGNKVEPKDQNKVHVRITSSRKLKGDTFKIYHEVASGSYSLMGSATPTGGSFDTGSFSIYIVIGEGETGEDARLSVVFHKADGSTTTEMITKRQLPQIEQYIFDPGSGVGEEDGVLFLGWADDEDYTATSTAYTIADIRSEVADRLNAGVHEGDQVHFWAMSFYAHVITYLDEENITIKTDKVMFRTDDTTSSHEYEVNYPYTPYVKEEYEAEGITAEFAGWEQLIPDATPHPVYQNGETIQVNEDHTFRAKVECGYWISYNENLQNASYTMPEFVARGDHPTEPDDPTREGYTFGGWYTEDASADRDGQVAGELFDFNQPLTQTTRVHAMWTQNTNASYSIVVWKQNVAGGDKYDFETSVTVNNATVGAEITSISAQGTGNDRYARINGTNYQYTGFHLSTAKGTGNVGYDTGITVAAEGNTVVNVYYDRNQYTLTFQIQNYNNWTTIHTITALYEQSISSHFPIVGTNGVTYDQGQRWDPQTNSLGWDEVMVYIDTMPAGNVNFHLDTANRPLKTMNYYVEALPTDTGTVTAPNTLYKGTNNTTVSPGNRRFVLYKSISARYNGVTEEDLVSLNGFTLLGADSRMTQRSGTWFYIYNEYNDGTLNIYYTRNTYDIIYRDGVYVNADGIGVQEDKLPDSYFTDATGIPYQSDISDKGDYTPTRDGYVFLGWYADDVCSQTYTFDTMPANKVTVYAKWVAAQINVVFHPNDSTDDQIIYNTGEVHYYAGDNSIYAAYGDNVGNVGGERQNFDLVGWFTNEALTQPFDFDAFSLNDSIIARYGDPDYREDGWPSVVGQLNLYAKWRSKLIGADGIQVVYDPNDTTDAANPIQGTDAPVDSRLYTDKAESVAASASKPVDEETYVFSHWIVQKWNGSAFVDTDKKVFPGDTFSVFAANARITKKGTTTVVPPANLVDGEEYDYVVQLRAVYVEKDKEVLTFINWYNNYDGGKVAYSENIKINEAVPVPEAPTRDGYKFLGWIRGIEEDGTTTTLTDLFITYDEASDTYSANYVACDEVLVGDGTQHHAMYAKWQPITYFVHFDKNADDATGTMEDQEFEYDEQKALSANAFERENYVFKGWSTDPNATTATYTDKQEVKNLTTEDGETVTLYAIWELDVADVTVHHYLKGTSTKVAEDTVAENQQITSTYTAQAATTFLADFEGYTLTAAEYDPSASITVKKDGNVITIYYTLPLTITAETKSKEYDGEVLTGEFTLEGALEADEEAIEALLGDPLEIGPDVTPATEYQAAVEGIPSYYVITNNPGTLEITKNKTKVTVTITENSDEVTYDGQPHTITGYKTIESDNELYDVTTAVKATETADWTVTKTDAGTYDMGIKPADFENLDTNFENVEFKIVDGQLVINPVTEKVTVTITENSDEVTYDGQPHTIKGYKTMVADNELYDVTTSVKETETEDWTVTKTDVGTYDMGIKPADFENTNPNFTNVEFVITDGQLVIKPVTDKVTVTIVENSDEVTYDGNEHTIKGYKSITADNPLYDVTTAVKETETADWTVTKTDAGTYDMGIKPEDFENLDKNFSNVEFVITDGQLVIKPVTDEYVITVTGKSDTKVYDGNEHSVNGYEYSEFDPTITITKELAQDDAKATAKGTLVGTYTMAMTAADFAATSVNYTKITFQVVPGTLEITDDDIPDELVVTKTVDGKKYKLGEEVKFTVTATNIYNEAKTITFTEIEGVTLEQSVFENVAAGETVTTTATYTITEADILAGSFTNTVTAKLGNIEKKASATANTEAPNGHLKIEKKTTSTPENGEAYALGETIEYEITVTNDGNLTITEIQILDELTGGKWTIDSLAPGESKTFTTSYVVTEEDILAGEVLNVATGSGKSPDPENPDVPVEPGEDPEPTEDPNGHLKIEKKTTSTPANGESYALGETIEYEITVTNDGNLTITDIEVLDELTGGKWTIDSLAPGESQKFTTSYVVTEEDILAGEVLNVATGSGKSPDPENPDVPVEPGEDPEPTDKKNAKLTVEKETTSKPANGAYVLDEQITYKVTVKNEGNVTLTNIQIADPLTGDTWTIASLAPNESKEFTPAAYTVTVDDVVAGSVKNVATATATDPEGETVNGEGSVEDETKKRDDNDVNPEPDPDDPGESMDADSKSITVVYDGKSHTVSGSATAEGSTIWYQYDGGEWTTTPPSRIEVGTTPFSIKATHPAYEDVVKDGYSLTVLPKDLTITIDDKSKVYGTEDPEFTYSVEGLVEGETFPTNLLTIWRDEGEDVGTYPIHGKIGGGETVTAISNVIAAIRGTRAFAPSNYDITINEGELEITPATVTVTADDQTKTEGQKDPEFTVTIDGLVNGDDESVISYTIGREPGEKPGEYAITPEGAEEQGNYIVVFVPGTLTIKSAPEPEEIELVWLSDLALKGEGAYDDAFKAIVDYIVENESKALAVLQSGNMVDAFDNEAAWTSAKDNLKNLATPFLGVAGAKDVNGDEMNYDAYLAAALNSNATKFEDGSIWYRAFGGDQPILVVGIGHQKIAETDEEKERQDKWLTFVNNAVAAKKDSFVILLVNDYIDAAGELTEFGKLLEEKVVKDNENVRLILCGGADGVARVEKTYGERKVAALMFNYTADADNGLGFFRVLTINPEDLTISVETINAIDGKVKSYDPNATNKDQFVLSGLFDEE